MSLMIVRCNSCAHVFGIKKKDTDKVNCKNCASNKDLSFRYVDTVHLGVMTKSAFELEFGK
jgi:hypothetical protein